MPQHDPFSTAAPSAAAVFADRASTTLFWRRRPLFWLSLAFCCGIVIDNFTEPRLPTLGGLFLGACALSLALLTVASAARGWRLAASGIAVAISGGMLVHAMQARIPAGDDISRRTSSGPSFVCVRGVILETSRERESERPVWTLGVRALGPDFAALTPASGRVRIRINTQASQISAQSYEWGEGDTVELRARIEAPPDVTIPGAFDSAGRLEALGIRRTGVATGESVRLAAPPSWLRPDLLLRRFSSGLAARLDQALNPAGTPEASAQPGLLNALLFGRRDHVDTSDREAFAVNGTAHLLAIAGWHLQFLTMLFWMGLSFMGIPRRKAAWIVIAAFCAFCALAGAATPVVRATIMIVIYLLAPALSRESDPLSALAAAALAILTVAPAELFTAGFQLSFLAVLALATLYPALDDAWTEWRASRELLTLSVERGWRSRLALRVRQLAMVSLVAWLGAAPAVAWHMGRLSLLSLLVNLIAVPLGGVCMIAGLAALAGTFLWSGAAALLGTLAFYCIVALQALNAGFARLPAAALDLPPPAFPVLFAYASVLAWIWVERRRGATLARTIVLVPLSLALLGFGAFFREAPAAPRVTVLDLRLGRAALIESPQSSQPFGGGAAMIDAGGPGQGAYIAEALRREGVSRLALLVISADEPDALGGAAELLQRIPVARVILPRGGAASGMRRDLERTLALRGIPFDWPDAKQALRGPGDVVWEFLDDGAPGPVAAETCLSVRLSLPGVRMLFAASRSNPGLQRLIANDTDSRLACDVLRISNVAGSHWPAELPELIRACGCRTIVAGQSSAPAEIAGFDLTAWAAAHDIRILAPRLQGSLRIQADTGSREQQVQAFRGGQWRPAE